MVTPPARHGPYRGWDLAVGDPKPEYGTARARSLVGNIHRSSRGGNTHAMANARGSRKARRGGQAGLVDLSHVEK